MAKYVQNFTQPVVLNALEDHGEFVNALSEKNTVRARELVEQMYHADMRDEYDRTPLMYAVLKDCSDTMHYLFEKNANPELRDQEGYTVLHRAAQMGNDKHVEAIIKHAIASGINLQHFLEIKSCRGITALCSAAMLGYVDVVTMLVSYGANIAVKNYDGYSMLMTLAIKGHANVLELLLLHSENCDQVENKLDVNETNSKGWTALHFAAYHNQKASAEVLLYYGANVNAVDQIGMTPLMMTAKCEMAIFLISNGAYINKTTEEGESVFTRALRNHQEKLLKLLIAQHANLLDDRVQAVCARELPISLHEMYIQERDEQKVAFQLLTMGHANDIKLAYDEAKKQDNLYLMNAIDKWFAHQKQCLWQACKNQDLFVISDLLHKGIDPLECAYYSMNCLQYSMLSRRCVVVELLLTYIDHEKLGFIDRLILKILGYHAEHLQIMKQALLKECPMEASDISFPQSVLSMEDDVSHPLSE